MATPPLQHHHHPTAVAPTISPLLQSPPSKSPIDFSPPLITMLVLSATAFLVVTYSRLISRHLFPPFLRLFRRYRRWRRRRYLSSDVESLPPFYESSDGFFVYSPYGLDDYVIKNIPLTIYKLPKGSNPKSSSSPSKLGLIDQDEFNDCAVCLLEFEVGDYIRTLPLCSHSFHVDCIDIWLRSHATCPLCRAGVYLPRPPESPLSPVMAARIRPSLDEGLLLESMFLEPLVEAPEQNSGEIQPATTTDDFFSPRRIAQSEDRRSNRRELDFLLKRSYSFGFERSFALERIVIEEPLTTPYHHHRRRSFLWTKRERPSSTPFSSIAKSRIFSFRGPMKSPAIFRRRNFFPPMFGRSPASSRMRCGDPEALLSPER